MYIITKIKQATEENKPETTIDEITIKDFSLKNYTALCQYFGKRVVSSLKEIYNKTDLKREDNLVILNKDEINALEKWSQGE